MKFTLKLLYSLPFCLLTASAVDIILVVSLSGKLGGLSLPIALLKIAAIVMLTLFLFLKWLKKGSEEKFLTDHF